MCGIQNCSCCCRGCQGSPCIVNLKRNDCCIKIGNGNSCVSAGCREPETGIPTETMHDGKVWTLAEIPKGHECKHLIIQSRSGDYKLVFMDDKRTYIHSSCVIQLEQELYKRMRRGEIDYYK